jgi:hypothetical protein
MSLVDQIWEMRRMYPGFKLTYSHSWLACWEGDLYPLSGQKYRVRICYQLAHRSKGFHISAALLPTVQLIEPKLSFENDCPDHDKLIHVYPHPVCPELSYLCLDDPKFSGWHDAASIANTIIPWTIDWLACYELWQATGNWSGGGRDHRFITPEQGCQGPLASNEMWGLARQELYVKGEYLGLGRKIENFAFSALTEAVYAAFSQRPCLPNLKNDFCLPVAKFTNASTSLPVLPLAA